MYPGAERRQQNQREPAGFRGSAQAQRKPCPIPSRPCLAGWEWTADLLPRAVRRCARVLRTQIKTPERRLRHV